MRARRPQHSTTEQHNPYHAPLSKNLQKGIIRPWYVFVVWAGAVPALVPEGLPPLWATALYDFVFLIIRTAPFYRISPNLTSPIFVKHDSATEFRALPLSLGGEITPILPRFSR